MGALLNSSVSLAYVVLALFAAMLALVEIGRRIGARHRTDGLGSLEAAIFGIMGLLMAFTFGNAAVRFENRRGINVDEANYITTAYLRLDLLPAAAQPALRDAFRDYVDTRIAIWRTAPDPNAARAKRVRMAELQRQIWDASVTGLHELSSPAATMLLLSALNDMFDITTRRAVAVRTQQAPIIFIMLAAVMLTCSLLAGFGMGASAKRSWFHVVCFTFVLVIAFYAILDLEYPRVGLVRIDWADFVLDDVRKSMQ
jgi:hypothetical protein